MGSLLECTTLQRHGWKTELEWVGWASERVGVEAWSLAETRVKLHTFPLFMIFRKTELLKGDVFLQMRSITVTCSCSTFQLKYTCAMFLTIQVCQSDRHRFKWDVSSSAWYSCSPTLRQYVIPLPDITHKHTLHLALVVYMIASEEYIPGNIMCSGWFFSA